MRRRLDFGRSMALLVQLALHNLKIGEDQEGYNLTPSADNSGALLPAGHGGKAVLFGRRSRSVSTTRSVPLQGSMPCRSA